MTVRTRWPVHQDCPRLSERAPGWPAIFTQRPGWIRSGHGSPAFAGRSGREAQAASARAAITVVFAVMTGIELESARLIQLSHISKAFGKVLALDDVSLE